MLTAIAGALFWRRFNAAPPAQGELFPADLVNYYYPRGVAVAQRLLAGELPLWNPDLCAGIPELATLQSAVLSPQTWLFALLPPALALPLRMLCECLLGGAFAVLFLRRQGLDLFAAALGGALFLSTCLLGQSFWPPQISTLLWLPWLCCCVESLLQRWRWRWWLGLVAGTALQLLAGFPQFALYSFQLVGFYALLRALALRGAGASALRTLGGMAAAVALGVGVAGAQILPTAELAGQSVREDGLSAREVHYLSGGSRASGVLRNAVDPSPKLLTFDYQGGGNYVGIATLLLLALGAALGPPGLVWPLLLFGALALLLSDGFHGPGAPLYRAYAALPGVGVFRTPERLRVLTLVSVIVVACVGLDRVGRGLRSLSRRRALAAAASVVLVAALVSAFGEPAAAPRAALALAALAAAALARREAWRRCCQALLLLLAVADVLAATGPYGSLRGLPRWWTERLTVFGLPVRGDEMLPALRRRAGWQRVEVERAMPYSGNRNHHERLICIEPLAPGNFAKLRDTPRALMTLYDIASVAWVARARPDPPNFGFQLEVHQNSDALPRAYWIERSTSFATEEALSRVELGRFDFRAGVLLEEDVAASPPAGPPQGPVPARILLHAPERVELELDAPRDGFLVLTDTWYPGWLATLDGREVEILRANGVFRAVRVPRGTSRVVFEYRPRSFRNGLALSAASLAVAAALPLAALSLRRRGSRLASRDSRIGSA